MFNNDLLHQHLPLLAQEVDASRNYHKAPAAPPKLHQLSTEIYSNTLTREGQRKTEGNTRAHNNCVTQLIAAAVLTHVRQLSCAMVEVGRRTSPASNFKSDLPNFVKITSLCINRATPSIWSSPARICGGPAAGCKQPPSSYSCNLKSLQTCGSETQGWSGCHETKVPKTSLLRWNAQSKLPVNTTKLRTVLAQAKRIQLDGAAPRQVTVG